MPEPPEARMTSALVQRSFFCPLGVNRMEAVLMGAVLGAVSPAVVVPKMVQLMEGGYGTRKSIP